MGVEGAHEAGLLTDGHIPVVAQGLDAQLNGLLRAGGDENIVKIPTDAVLLLHVGRQMAAQRPIALGGAVLQGVDGALGQNPVGNPPDILHREGLRRRVAGREGNHLRIGGVFENFTDGGRVQIFDIVGKTEVHIVTFLYDDFTRGARGRLRIYSYYCSIYRLTFSTKNGKVLKEIPK